ncbi:MAG: hypothetical protein PHE55_18195 [Methylococcaceae bacterium]|nr:hypothetical protein [Methylococcaceae bacterium]
MMDYLDRLKNLDFEKQAPKELQKPQKAPYDFSEMPTLDTALTAKSPFYSFCSTHGGHFQKIDSLFWRFTVTQPDGSTANFTFASGGTLAEAEAHAEQYWPGSTVTPLEAYPTDPHRQGEPIDISALAAEIAREFGIDPAQCLALLDDEDRQAIGAGDTGMVEAWKGFVGLALRRNNGTLPEAEERAGAELWAVCFTPAGAPIRIKAQDAEHLAWLLKMNGSPTAEAARSRPA